MDANSRAIDRLAPASAKIALFRSLFRGRNDVYPRRFESRTTGRSGYAPACAREWVRGICEKPRVYRVALARSCWSIHQYYRELKDDLGLDHFTDAISSP